MTSTLNALTIDLINISESFEVVQTQWDDWEDNAYVRRVKPIGIVKTWTLLCKEYNTKWTSSVAYQFEAIAVAGSTVALVVDFGSVAGGSLHNFGSTNVKILGVNVTYDVLKSGQAYREFTVVVQAV